MEKKDKILIDRKLLIRHLHAFLNLYEVMFKRMLNVFG